MSENTSDLIEVVMVAAGRVPRRSDPIGRAAAVAIAVVVVALAVPVVASARPVTAKAPMHPSSAAGAVAGTFRAVAVTRVLASASVPTHGSTSVAVTGHGVPVNATAVLVTVTETSSAGGYLTVWPTGATRPATGNLNVPAGATASDSAVVRLGTGGQVAVYNGSVAAATVSLDVAGYYVGGPVSTPGGFRPVPAARILDTGNGVGSTRLAAHATLTLTVAGHGGVPAGGVGAVAVTVAAVSPSVGGTLPVSAYGTTPTVAELTFYAHRSVAKLVLVALGSGGRVRLTNQSDAPLDLVADVAGYFLAGTPTAQGAYRPVPARRLLDTGSTPVPAHGSRTISLTQRAGLDVFDLTAAAVSVTAYGATGSGGLEVGGADQPVPPPAVAYNTGYTGRTTLLVAPSANGGLTITNTGAHAVGVLVDLDGYAVYPKPTWHAGPEVAPPYGGPQAISCPTSTFCAAVDEPGSARTFNGTTWSAPVLVDTDSTGYGLAQVSCWTAGACIAVGTTGSTFELSGGLWRKLQADYHPPQYTEATALVCLSGSFCMLELSLTGVTIFDGHGWGSLALTATNQVSDQADAISCASTTFCLALPWQGRDVWQWDGTSWTSAGTVDSVGKLVSVSCPTTTFCKIGESGDNTLTYNGAALSAQQPGPSGGVNSMTCTSATFCVAITSASYNDGVSTFNGASWSATVTLVASTSDYQLQSLSCADASHCHAIDSSGNDFRYNGHTWAAAVSFDPFGHSLITGLSCPTSTFCVLTEQGGAVWMLTGATWSGPEQFGDYAGAVSCASPTFCVVVASDGFRRWNGTTWHLENVPGSASADSISCPSATFCMSVGTNTERYDGTRWTEGTIPVAGVDVSCTSATFCAALVGVYQNPDPDHTNARARARSRSDTFISEQATTYNGASWSAPVTLKNFTWSQSISCGAPSYCVATGLAYDGTAEVVSTTYSGGVWGPFVPIGRADGHLDFDASDVSCHGAGFCLASYGMEGVVTKVGASNGARWGTGMPAGHFLMALSCPSATFCVGVDSLGRAYTWS